MRKLLFSRRGETLAEVMCAAAVIVIALGTLLGAVRFSSSAQRRAEQMGLALEQLRCSLAAAEAEPSGETAEYVFTAETAGVAQAGEAEFSVTAALGRKTGTYTGSDGTETAAVFSVFLPPEEGGAS